MAVIDMRLLPRASLESMIQTPRGIAIFVVGLIFTITAFTSFMLRLWAKKITKSRFFVEDWLCLGSLVSVVGLFICLVLHIQLGGVGHHYADLPPEDLANTLKILVAFQTLYALAVGAVKTSICHFYIRIFFSIDRRNRLIVYGVIVFIWLWVIMSILVAYLSCMPFEATWNPELPGGHCDNQIASFVAEAVLDLLADAAVFTLPLRSIYNLQISSAKKSMLFVVFGLGLSTMAMAILRIVGLVNLSYSDFEYTSPTSIIATLLEPAIGISVASIPLMQPVIQNTWFGKRLAGSSRSRQRLVRPQNKGFDRFGDEYPLDSTSKESNASVSAEPALQSGQGFTSIASSQNDAPSRAGNYITVRHEFSTSSM